MALCSHQSVRLGAIAAAVAAVVACGGGGGGGGGGQQAQTLSGTAAAGAPLLGTVTVKDSAGRTRVGAITMDGRYTIDVAGMTPPFMVRADGTVGGKAFSLYSAAVAADVNGNLNVTPLTDLIVANVAQDLAVARYESGQFSVFTRAELDAREGALRAKLTPILSALGVATSVDLLRASFAADHSGLDAALDLLDVEVDTSTKIATIRNVVNGSTVQNDIATRELSGTIDPGDAATAISTLQALTVKFEQLNALFATRVPTASEIEALDLFDTAAFLDGGQTWGLFVGELTSGEIPPGITFTNLSIESGLGQARMKGAIDVFDPDGRYGGTLETFFDRDGQGTYRAIGNQWAVAPELVVHANDDDGLLRSGFLFDLRDPQGLFPGGTARLSGPGVSGVTYYQTDALPRFTRQVGQDWPNIFLTDAEVAQIPALNAVYRLEVFAADAADPSLTYDLPVGARPLAPSALARSMFLQETGFSHSNAALAAFAGGTISATWSVPPGLRPEWFFVVFQDGAGHRIWMDGSISPGGAAGSVSIPGSAFQGWSIPRNGFSYAGGRDAFGREFETRLALF